MKKLLLPFCLLLTTLSSMAYDAKINGIYYDFSGTEATVTYETSSYGGYWGNVIIPKSVTYNGTTYSVTSIDSKAFYKCVLISIDIPNSVTSIGYRAFEGCNGLKSAIIPNSVTSIGSGAFFGCSGLEKIVVNSGNAFYDSREGCNAIIETASNTLIVGCKNTIIPNSVTSIGDMAFYDCSGLTSVTIPNSVTNIGDYAFQSCSGLTSIIIPNSVTSIGNQAFWGCTGLTSVTIPNSVTSIGPSAFYGTAWYDNQPDGLVYVGKVAYKYKGTMPEGTSIVLEEGTLGIADYAFSGNRCLTSISIPNSVTNIGNGSFLGCWAMTSITIGNSVASIGQSAFNGCWALTSIIIPNSVTSIGIQAFYDCDGLKTIVVNSGNTIYDSREGCNAIIETSSNTLIAGCKNTIIPNSVTSIGDYAFGSCSGLTSVTIPNSVTSIADYAFQNCSRLTSVTIPNCVTTIGNDAFYSCTGLTSITIGNSVTSIGDYAFNGCTRLTSVTIPNSVEYIGKNAFPTDITYYVSQPGPALILLWNNKFIAVDKITGNTLALPSFSVKSTVSSVGITVNGYYPQLTYTLTVMGKSDTYAGNVIHFTGLNPETNGSASLEVSSGNQSYSLDEISFNTDALTLETQQPKVISEGNVIVAAKSNLDDVETNVGFEWRRQDWNDDFDSKTGGAYLYNGEMEGYIRSINPNYLWKFRPYYEANDGTRYYGEWKGMDPSDYSYFEPTVHTYASVTVNENTAMVKGYAQRGTDNVTSQGFLYWPNDGNYVKAEQPMRVTEVPDDAKKVTAKGTVMTAKLTGLSYNTTYSYVAFVETSEGETFYGEEMTFQTGDDLTGIEPIHNAPSIMHNEEAIYDLQGRRQTRMQKGINIIRMSNGTVRKVLVK